MARTGRCLQAIREPAPSRCGDAHEVRMISISAHPSAILVAELASRWLGRDFRQAEGCSRGTWLGPPQQIHDTRTFSYQ